MQSVLEMIKAEPLIPVLAEMQEEEATLAGANFGILKTSLKKLENGSLTGAERQKLRQAMDATGTTYPRFNSVLAARREVKNLQAEAGKIDELLEARTAAEKSMLVYNEETKATQGRMRAELSADVTGGKLGAGPAGERWSAIERFPNERRPGFDALAAAWQQAKVAVDYAANAQSQIDALQKEFGGLLD